MQVEITPIFLILAAVIGLLVGLLVASLFTPRESKSNAPTEPPEELAKDGFTEAARLWYSPSGKRVITELDGEYYREYQPLTPEQKGRVNNLIEQWLFWAGKSNEKTAHMRILPAVIDSEESESLPEVAPVLNWSVAEAIKLDEKTDPALVPESEKPKTIAGQISQIIDKMLEGNPLKEKGIKLIENSHQGVDVWIGLEKFEGIDAIPYPDVQQLIRQAVTQWESESETAKKTI